MRLLLAEDERDLSDALVAILKHNNYSVDAVYNGEDALNYLEADNYDGAILDIMMPKMDGITVLKNIRAQGNDIPVLILTAKSEVDDSLSLDCTTFELKSPTDVCRLPNKEFQVMELLAANPSQVISTDRFMEKIWGYDSDADVGVVWVYISYLRKRLTAVGANVKIKAARGQGYYLEIQS